MLISYSKGGFPDEYVPTILDQYAATVVVDQTPYLLELVDTAGQEDYDRLRPLSYNNADIFLVCYSVVIPSSLTNVKEKWIPELKEHSSETPYILVGTQIDLREDANQIQKLSAQKQQPTSTKTGHRKAAKLGAASYRECSAVTMDGIKDVFDEAIRHVLCKDKDAPKRSCVIS